MWKFLIIFNETYANNYRQPTFSRINDKILFKSWRKFNEFYHFLSHIAPKLLDITKERITKHFISETKIMPRCFGSKLIIIWNRMFSDLKQNHHWNLIKSHCSTIFFILHWSAKSVIYLGGSTDAPPEFF